jgi:ATP-dependent Clp protease ATP-binding subunit ClpC
MMNKHLPDKAIDLIDEAAARVSTLSQKLDNDDAYVAMEKKISKIKDQIASSIDKQDYFKAAELKDTEEELKKKLTTIRSQHNLPKHLRPHVEKLDVGKVLSDKM